MKIINKAESINLGVLVESIKALHNDLKLKVYQSINVALTLRNWLIGYYISVYELEGTDRAEYGEKLIDRLSEKLKSIDIPRTSRRDLYRYCQFYRAYPEIVDSLNTQFKVHLNFIVENFPEETGNISSIEIVDSLNTQLKTNIGLLITSLSYAHIEVLLGINDKAKRCFYESECIEGNWSVREFKRQVNSLYYERSGLSVNKDKLAALANQNANKFSPNSSIRDPYIFEFLGLKAKEVMSESHLENQLLDKLQEFLLELGHGFCFEARQKRILIGETNYYIDLVFYHRILKCHVLVELKLADFNHENIGQLNTYVNWYRKNVKQEDDNDPIGLLLCTAKDDALVEYALAGMDNQLFVSKYLLELPSKENIKQFLRSELKQNNASWNEGEL